MSEFRRSYEQSSTGYKVFSVFSWIICGVAILLALIFGVLYFTKKPAEALPESPVPADATIRDDKVVVYDQVKPNEAQSLQFENTYFKNVLFKCAGTDVPDTAWDAPFDAAATHGNMVGVTRSAPAASAPSATDTTTSPPISGQDAVDATPNDGGAAPQGGDSFRNISRSRAPPHRYPFW